MARGEDRVQLANGVATNAGSYGAGWVERKPGLEHWPLWF